MIHRLAKETRSSTFGPCAYCDDKPSSEDRYVWVSTAQCAVHVGCLYDWLKRGPEGARAVACGDPIEVEDGVILEGRPALLYLMTKWVDSAIGDLPLRARDRIVLRDPEGFEDCDKLLGPWACGTVHGRGTLLGRFQNHVAPFDPERQCATLPSDAIIKYLTKNRWRENPAVVGAYAKHGVVVYPQNLGMRDDLFEKVLAVDGPFGVHDLVAAHIR